MVWNYYTICNIVHIHSCILYTPAVVEVVLLELLDTCIYLYCLLLEKDQ